MSSVDSQLATLHSPLPPGYKLTEVGLIPEDWGVISVEAITTKVGDGLHGTPVYSQGGSFFFINGNNLDAGRIVVTTGTQMVGSSEFVKHRKPLSDRSILMSINGTIGNLGLYDGEPVVLGKSVAYLNVKSGISKHFVYHALQINCVKQQFFNGLTGSTIGNLGLATIRRAHVPLPPKEAEQLAIASALSDVDALLAALDRLIAKKRDLKQAAMQQLLTGQTRLPGFKGEWVAKTISEVANLYQPTTISAKQFTDSGYPVYGANGVVGYYHSANHRTSQVTVTCRGSTCGTVNRTVDECWITGNAMVLNCDENNEIDKQFFYHLMLGQDLSDCITGTGQPQIVRSPLAAFRVELPKSVSEQTAIAEVLSDMDAEIAVLEQRREKTRSLKQGMMQELLTGRTRLI
jgi:type I restriction enzyme S subunit